MATSVCLLEQEPEMANFHMFAANGNEICFPWSANDKREPMISVSANVAIYADVYDMST
jgi:hypothetical protein